MCDTDMSKPVASLVIVQAQKVQTSSTASTLQRCEGPCGWWYLNWGVFISSYIKTHRSLFLIFSLYIGIAVSAIITIYISLSSLLSTISFSHIYHYYDLDDYYYYGYIIDFLCVLFNPSSLPLMDNIMAFWWLICLARSQALPKAWPPHPARRSVRTGVASSHRPWARCCAEGVAAGPWGELKELGFRPVVLLLSMWFNPKLIHLALGWE